MEILNNVSYGFSIVLQPSNILFCFLGVLLGTLVGVLPGIGPLGTMSILLPVTFHMSPIPAVVMLAGIYYGSMYGGSTTSILVNIPGEAAAVVTCLDGYEMAKQGRAGAALGIAAFGSFIAGTLGVVGLMIFASPLARFGLKFGAPEYFSVLFLGLTLVTHLSGGSAIKALMTACFGIILSCVGLDCVQASPRMTFDLMELWNGLDLVPIAMGLFGIGEIATNIEQTASSEILKEKIKNIFPSLQDWKQATGPILRGSVLGFFLGVLPGGGSLISSFFSYSLEKKIAKDPSRFGKGAIEGVAGPESANNSATSGAFVPFLTLGIPPNVVMALLFAALLIHGLRPGPFLISEHPDVFWGLICSMYIGNVMLLILNLPLIPLWVQVLKVPYRILFPLIILFCIVGSYSVNNRASDVFVMVIFGVLGYLFRKFHYDAAPLLLGFILGPLIELNLRQSLILSKGSAFIFFSRPISAVAISFAIITMFILPVSSHLLRKKRSELLSP